MRPRLRLGTKKLKGSTTTGRTRFSRTLTGLVALSAGLMIGVAPTASAQTVHIGPFPVEIPEFELPTLDPVPVPVPVGSEAAPLPPLPYPLEWQRPVPPPPPPAPTPAPHDPFSGRTVVLDCGHSPERMPSQIIYFCGNGTGGFRDIHWNAWSEHVAHGSATKFWVVCEPSCARGSLRTQPVGISLTNPRQTDSGLAFSTLTSHENGVERRLSPPGFMSIGDDPLI